MSNPSEEKKTDALKRLENNLDSIHRLIVMNSRQPEIIFPPVHRLIDELKVGQIPDVKRLGEAIQNVVDFVESLNFLHGWMLVMLTSFVEAYVEDALLQLLAYNPCWMDDMRLKVSFSDVNAIRFSAESFNDIRLRWQKAWTGDIVRRPEDWIRLFSDLGATGYRAGLAEELRGTWKRRNEIVHSGKPVIMKGPEFGAHLNLVDDFTSNTDRFVLTIAFAHGASGQ
jgi:hypothetical protein